jgi:glucose-6-phosphate 1-dehydrogenase
VKYKNILITLKTGKALDRKVTLIDIHYKGYLTKPISLQDDRNAYENVFLDAIASNKTYFLTPDEVIETWRIVKPVQGEWKKGSGDLGFYKVGASI